MRQSFNCFVSAAVLAGVTACGAAANAEMPLKTPNSPDRLSESFRLDMLGFARLSSAKLTKNAADLLIATHQFKESAKSGNLSGEMCEVLFEPESKQLPHDLKEAFEESVLDEVTFGGETEAGQQKRVSMMSQVIQSIDENIEFTTKECQLKFGA